MISRFLASFLVICCSVLGTAAITLNQTDNFQDGTTMSWGGGSSPGNISTGGPAGAGDKYLQISAAGGFLATFNTVQWAGNYTAATVDRIEVDLRNTGPNPLEIRLILFATNTDRWSSVSKVVLPPNSSWVHASFDVLEANFVHTTGTGAFSAMMANMSRIMFRHEPVITAGGTAVTGALGIDNITGYAKTIQLQPNAYNIVIGIPQSGALPDLFTSDDLRLSIRQDPSRSRQDPAVSIETHMTAPSGSFSILRLSVETLSSAVPVALVNQRILLWDFQTSGYVQIDARPCTSADQTVMIELPSNVNRFVHPSTREIRAKLSYFDPGTLLTRSWGVSFDLVSATLIR
jgi:hypothetical protein